MIHVRRKASGNFINYSKTMLSFSVVFVHVSSCRSHDVKENVLSSSINRYFIYKQGKITVSYEHKTALKNKGIERVKQF